MSLDKPTPEEFQKMYDTKMQLCVLIDGVTYSTIEYISSQTGETKEEIAARALFLGITPLLEEYKAIMKKLRDEGVI